jgi:hypothetical protein
MNRREWVRSGLLILVLLVLAVLIAQSRRNCEIPGSSFVPCVWGEPLKPQTLAECKSVERHWDPVAEKCTKKSPKPR